VNTAKPRKSRRGFVAFALPPDRAPQCCSLGPDTRAAIPPLAQSNRSAANSPSLPKMTASSWASSIEILLRPAGTNCQGPVLVEHYQTFRSVSDNH
jgi:hypothetical protein